MSTISNWPGENLRVQQTMMLNVDASIQKPLTYKTGNLERWMPLNVRDTSSVRE